MPDHILGNEGAEKQIDKLFDSIYQSEPVFVVCGEKIVGKNLRVSTNHISLEVAVQSWLQFTA